MAKVVFYTEDHVEELEAEIFRLKCSLHSERQSVEALEALRPHWAQGYSSDSVAAQAAVSALSELWRLLCVDNQTTAMGRLRELTAST